MKCLITGASGFIGTNLTKELCKKNFDVRILAREKSDLSEFNNTKISVAKGDVLNLESLMTAMKDIEIVFHLAGYVGYTSFEKNIMNKINVKGTENVLIASKENKIRKFIHMSSVVTVGIGSNPNQISNENTEYNWNEFGGLLYAESKKKAEELVLEFTHKKYFESTILNPSSAYGERDAKKGSRSVQTKIAQGKFPFYTAGGANIVAIEDVVQATISAITKGKNGEKYLLTGENLTIKALFAMIAKEAGVKPPRMLLPKPLVKFLIWYCETLEKKNKKGPFRSGSLKVASLYNWYDSSKAQSNLDFKPKPAIYGIRNSINWMKNNKLI